MFAGFQTSDSSRFLSVGRRWADLPAIRIHRSNSPRTKTCRRPPGDGASKWWDWSNPKYGNRKKKSYERKVKSYYSRLMVNYAILSFRGVQFLQYKRMGDWGLATNQGIWANPGYSFSLGTWDKGWLQSLASPVCGSRSSKHSWQCQAISELLKMSQGQKCLAAIHPQPPCSSHPNCSWLCEYHLNQLACWYQVMFASHLRPHSNDLIWSHA